MVGRDARSSTFSNLAYLAKLTGLNVWEDTPVAIKRALPVKSVPEGEQWRLGLLTSLLRMRADRELAVESTGSD